jgi:hypothetical protein
MKFQEVEVSRFQNNRYMKVVGLSNLRTGRLYPPGNIPSTHFCWRLRRPQEHRAAERIRSMKNFSDTIGYRTCDLPARSAVPQPTAPDDNRKAIVLYMRSIMLSNYSNIDNITQFEALIPRDKWIPR